MNANSKAAPRAKSITTLAALVEAGLVLPADALALETVVERYALAITPRMQSSEPGLARQFVPDPREVAVSPLERADPIGDFAHSPVHGLVHRYPDRVLLKITHSCPVYCRFCFRREMVGPSGDGTLSEAQLDTVFDYIAAHPEIFEILITGGDPLVLSSRRLAALGERIAAHAHVKVVRYHSRVPVVAPERITPAMIHALKAANRPVYVAVHANHPLEFGPEAQEALAQLADAGFVLVGQTVLLNGVNADALILRALFQAMVANRITPLYLHHPDLAPGTGHFRLSIAEGQALYAQLRGTLSGTAIPAYMLDLPGGHGKVEIGASRLSTIAQGNSVQGNGVQGEAGAPEQYFIRAVDGSEQVYPPKS